MPHNVSLPKHRYVYVYDALVLNSPEGGFIPAVWFGISSHPGRAIGCHVMLESGAVIVDLPPHALFHTRQPHYVPAKPRQTWDCFGWDMEVVEFPYLDGMSCKIRDDGHHKSGLGGQVWFAVDWKDNGYSNYPEQHKLMWCVAHNDGSIGFRPQDHLLFEDKSFTEGGIPAGGIKKQKQVWQCEV